MFRIPDDVIRTLGNGDNGRGRPCPSPLTPCALATLAHGDLLKAQ